MTQDVTLFLKNRLRVELTVVAIFEWVCQDESPFPSKKHKAKFVQDCMQLYLRSGHCREVHSVITDLSRAVAVKLVSLDDNLVPTIQKTATFDGKMVRRLLSQFVFASPNKLGVDAKQWHFNGNRVEAGKALGSGLHGCIFSVASSDTSFVKGVCVDRGMFQGERGAGCSRRERCHSGSNSGGHQHQQPGIVGLSSVCASK